MDAAPPAQLDSELGRAIVGAAYGLDPLAARTQLRRQFPQADDELLRAATVQAELAARALARFGPIADEVLWSADGLEQASRPGVARHRTRWLAETGVRRAVDLTCGLGIDALAMAAEGIDVVAVEQDLATASLATANARRLGGGHVEVVHGSCTDADVLKRAATADAWFVDPSRRSLQRGRDGRHLRLDNPEQWSPPWSWVVEQARRTGADEAGTPNVLMVKAAPGLPHDAIVEVPGCDVAAQWISQDGQLLETCVTWSRAGVPPATASAPLAAPDHPRAAVILNAEGDTVVRIDAETPPVRPGGQAIGEPLPAAVPAPQPGEYLFDPDPAIVRAGVVAELAAHAGARLVDRRLAYLAAPALLAEVLRPAARAWLVLASGDYDPRWLRAACAEHGIGHIDVTGRGRHLDPVRVRRDLRLPGGGGDRGVLVVMGLGAARTTFVCLCRAL